MIIILFLLASSFALLSSNECRMCLDDGKLACYNPAEE